MTRRKAFLILPWLSVVASIACGIAAALLEQENLAELGRPGAPFVTYLWPASWLGFQVVGAMLLSAGVRNRIALILMGIGASVFLNVATIAYARQTLIVDPGSLPFGTVAGWLGAWTLSGLGLVPLLLLLFPTGETFTRRWRPAAWLAIGSLILLIIWQMVAPVEVAGGPQNMPRFENPLGLEQLGGAAESVTGFIGFLLLVTGLIGVGSMIWRLLRGNRTERQQLKVLVYAVALLPVVLFVSGFLQNALRGDAGEGIIVAGFVIGFNGVAAAMGLSIVRYRLYDFDVVVNRTLVYGVLTAALLASYLLIVVTLSRVLDPVTRDSDIAVAASTLAVAALFRPLRARIQGFIDRRFYRSKYDASRAVAMFAARLRNEVDIDSVRGDVLTVVSTTLQPRHASLWVKEPT
ncbi:MAG: hypothetical protein M3277_07890 [Actinomycetota bacterium]|nr:hypothetical protein [Actinomycetota bacterium]